MPKTALALDRVFHALSDPTRRAVVERLGRGPVRMTELARPFQMALPSFSQHLDVLTEAGLVRSEKSGRIRTLSLEPQALEAIDGWLAQQRELWERRLDQLDTLLMTLKETDR
ncbi:MAG: metalloregulator ArsR/SmtB family transcription factor [Ancalomicrobiaceae bacterium]|nr:metalloregulator ArsR/SmtB family transcription factor [Ancalomicrobiaceae bacterium]